jgi:hypothetical protein
MKSFLIKLYLILSSQFGIDPFRFVRSIRRFPSFLYDWWKFRKLYTGRLIFAPCLHDRYEEGGVTKSEYFWQDLLVSRSIYKANPLKHLDIGSRIDGLVAHVASFREIEVIDVRPISTQIPGVTFFQADLMKESFLINGIDRKGYYDSISCLHAIEHFGLGRYGDPIDVHGHEKGIANISSLLKTGGVLYLSTPIGVERVEFNANRVFSPNTIINIAKQHNLVLELLIIITNGEINEVTADIDTLKKLAEEKYNLGIFTFKHL